MITTNPGVSQTSFLKDWGPKKVGQCLHIAMVELSTFGPLRFLSNILRWDIMSLSHQLGNQTTDRHITPISFMTVNDWAAQCSLHFVHRWLAPCTWWCSPSAPRRRTLAELSAFQLPICVLTNHTKPPTMWSDASAAWRSWRPTGSLGTTTSPRLWKGLQDQALGCAPPPSCCPQQPYRCVVVIHWRGTTHSVCATRWHVMRRRMKTFDYCAKIILFKFLKFLFLSVFD